MHDYIFLADMLNKYSQLTPWVQAVVVMCFCAVPLGMAYCVKATITAFARDKPPKP